MPGVWAPFRRSLRRAFNPFTGSQTSDVPSVCLSQPPAGRKRTQHAPKEGPSFHKQFPLAHCLWPKRPDFQSQSVVATLKASDELARRVSASPWTDEMSRKALKTLASISNDFRQPGMANPFQACRAERLVLALDRLFVSCKSVHPASSAEADLNRLFRQVQSLPEFNAPAFADVLNQVAHSLDE